MSLLLLMALVAAKPQIVVSSLTTEQLVERCRGKDTDTAATFCTGYIIAAFDTLSMTHQICPSPKRASTLQAVAMARRYLRVHDEKWDNAPAFVVRDALRVVFPCKR